MTALARLFSEGYRVFFLAAGLYGLFAGAIWVLYLAGDGPALAQVPSQWHAHEMVFGYATAALGGFFLTAVPSWTGAPGARQGFIALAAGMWLAGRLAVWYAGVLPPVWVAVLDLAFLPVLSLKIVTQLLKRPKPQNLMFLLFLAYLWAADLWLHLDWIGTGYGDTETGLRAGLAVLCALISVLGGRITPAFTRNAMKRAGVAETLWPVSRAPLERAAVVLALLLPGMVLGGAPAGLSGAVALAFGAVQALRLMRWGGLWCLSQPILWALHLALAMLAAGMILWGLAGLGLGSELAALHLLGIGCVGGMTLAVMSRAALGHSGRPLVAPGPMVLGYGLMAAAALTRWAGSGFEALYLPAMLLAAALWTAAFATYLAAMWPALIGPRAGAAG